MDKIKNSHAVKKYNIHDYDVPLTTVDMSIFSVIDCQLHVLLVKRKADPFINEWALPGGFIDLKKDKDIDCAAHRKLIEKTGIKSPYLEQVCSIGDKSRDPRGWAVTILYFSLIDSLTYNPGFESESESKWFNLQDAYDMRLGFDHNQLLKLAFCRLQSKTRYTALPLSLMPSVFTLTELQNIFEIILGTILQKKAFRKRILDSKAVIATNSNKIAGKRPAKLYKAANLPQDFEFPRAIESAH